jgi:enoyl-CoA hydratase/carnithine racemase
MTNDRPDPRVLRLEDDAGRALLLRADLDGLARVVVIEAGGPDLAPGEIEDVCQALARPGLISIGAAPQRPSAAAARVLLSCDFVVCAGTSEWDDARAEVAAAASRLLPPAQRARVTAWSGPVRGTDLLDAGLVTAVDADPAAAARELAAELQSVPATSLSGTKRMIAPALGSSLADALSLESEVQVAALAGPEHQQVVAAQLTARPSAQRSSPA